MLRQKCLLDFTVTKTPEEDYFLECCSLVDNIFRFLMQGDTEMPSAGNELQAVRRDVSYFCVECSALWKHWGPLGHCMTAPSLDSEWKLNSLSAFVPAGGNSSERQPGGKVAVHGGHRSHSAELENSHPVAKRLGINFNMLLMEPWKNLQACPLKHRGIGWGEGGRWLIS